MGSFHRRNFQSSLYGCTQDINLETVAWCLLYFVCCMKPGQNDHSRSCQPASIAVTWCWHRKAGCTSRSHSGWGVYWGIRSVSLVKTTLSCEVNTHTCFGLIAPCHEKAVTYQCGIARIYTFSSKNTLEHSHKLSVSLGLYTVIYNLFE